MTTEELETRISEINLMVEQGNKFAIAIVKMFEHIGVDFTAEKFLNDFESYSWTKEQFNSFKNWLIQDYLQDNETFDFMSQYDLKYNDKNRELIAASFLMSYSFNIVEEDE
jgi:hypothetical protein